MLLCGAGGDAEALAGSTQVARARRKVKATMRKSIDPRMAMAALLESGWGAELWETALESADTVGSGSAGWVWV
jgi:hypothetical protein